MVSSVDRDNLVQQIEQAILESHTDPAVGKFGPRPHQASHISGDQEPKEVARLIFGLPTALQSIWQRGVPAAMAGRQVEVGGRFCHMSPKVHWSDKEGGNTFTHKPELADLLVTVEHNGHRVALLVQTKAQKEKSNQSSVKMPLDDDGTTVQRYMYAKWPNFTVAKINIAPDAFDPEIEYDIRNHMNKKPVGAAWALITTNETNRDKTTSPVWLFEDAVPLPIPTYFSKKAFSCQDVTFDKSLAEVLASMMLGENSFGVAYGGANTSKTSPHGWPELIDRLIEFSRVRTGLASKGDYLKHLGISSPASAQDIVSAAKSYENISVLRVDQAGKVSAFESVATMSDRMTSTNGLRVGKGVIHHWDPQLDKLTYQSESFRERPTDVDIFWFRNQLLHDVLNPWTIPYGEPPAPPPGGNEGYGADRSSGGFAHLWIKIGESNRD
jgi:hypothetical protein